jgi:hypothetical protein
MIRILSILSLILVGIHQPPVHAQRSSGQCSSFEYVNHNQVDPPPLSVPAISGRVIDPNGVHVPGACLGLFREKGHRLLSTIVADDGGTFKFQPVRPGRYRLLVQVEGFCTANVSLRIGRSPRAGILQPKKLVIHMDARGIDRCSYVDYK